MVNMNNLSPETVNPVTDSKESFKLATITLFKNTKTESVVSLQYCSYHYSGLTHLSLDST